jgi:hypothetical protein
MFWDNITKEVLSFAGTFNIILAVSLFLILAINEFGLCIPYLLETVWILTGFHFKTGSLSLNEVVLIWVAVACGRMAGAWLFYSLVKLGSPGIMNLYRRTFGQYLAAHTAENSKNKSFPVKLWRKINLLSPYSVAFGRLFWLKVPLTITLGVRQQLKTLLLAILLSSVIWDTIYILAGVVGGTARIEPLWLVVYSLGALLTVNGIIYLIRYVIEQRISRQSTALKRV